jgi:hypothetical protein
MRVLMLVEDTLISRGIQVSTAGTYCQRFMEYRKIGLSVCLSFLSTKRPDKSIRHKVLRSEIATGRDTTSDLAESSSLAWVLTVSFPHMQYSTQLSLDPIQFSHLSGSVTEK